MSDRSDRLRQKRSSVSERVEEIDSEGETNESKPVKPDKTEKSEKPEETVKPKEDGEATQMWLPEDLRTELDLSFEELNLHVQRGGEESLKKLNHWYPMVVKAGLDAIDEMDESGLREEAEQLWE